MENEHALMNYHWPGNVRELESLMKRVVIFGESEIRKHINSHRNDIITASEINPRGIMNPSNLPNTFFEGKRLKEINDEVAGIIERRAIQKSLGEHGWNRKKTAKDLGISYRCLLYKIQQYNLQKEKSSPAT